MQKNNISYYTPHCVAKLFGTLSNGTQVYSYTISNSNGMEVTVINYGAAITSLRMPTDEGFKTDIVLGFNDVTGYIDSFNLPSPPYFGSVIGRYAGRINNAAFNLKGRPYTLNANHGAHTLHGGTIGFGRGFWKLKEIQGGEDPFITMAYTSAHGEEHFPGEVAVEVTYTLTNDNRLLVQYEAESDRDTVINLTQHTYFNLDGHSQSISGQRLFINSDKVLETMPDGIPTGNILKVANCPYDFRQARNVPAKIDTSFVLQDNGEPAASLYSPVTGIKMTVHTNQPSVHIYVGGNCFGLLKGKQGAAYHPQSGICFEAQNYPDAPNHSHFPSAVLSRGQVYRQHTSFKFEQLKK